MKSPDELDPDEIDARWNDITSELGDIEGNREIPRPSASGPRDYIVDEEDETFVPPEPESHTFRLRSILGWLLIAVGLVGILVVALSDASAGLIGFLFAAMAVSGLLVLVTGLPEKRDPDDDGAHV